ncbi:MAG: hypothetical protein J5808_05480 [Paludibacteraceae bacterium]|nr:hypothetical protein [Paludibacteraceae bacterium]
MEEVLIPQGYIDLGRLMQDFVEEHSLNRSSVLMKQSFLETIVNGPIGSRLFQVGFERGLLVFDLFESIIDSPSQIRSSSGRSLLLIRHYGSFLVSPEVYVKESDYAMRIEPVTVNGIDFWEFVDIDLHYNLKRNDPVLWTRE